MQGRWSYYLSTDQSKIECFRKREKVMEREREMGIERDRQTERKLMTLLITWLIRAKAEI